MHPKRLLQILKDSIEGFTNENLQEALSFLIDYSDDKNLIVPAKNNQIRLIDMDTILYVKKVKKDHVLIVTKNEEIEFNCASYDLLEYLDTNCGEFKYLNNGLAVNMGKVIKYHEYLRRLYFSDEKYVVVAGVAMDNIVKKVLGKDCAITQDTFSGKYEPYNA